MTSLIDDTGGRGFVASSRPDNQQIFMRAQRHSRRVRFMRYAVPAVALLVFGGLSLMSWLDPMRMLARLPTASGQLAFSGTKIMMHNPKLAGFTKDARPYELLAKTAAQDITNPDVVELNEIRATMESPDKTTVTVTAIDGVFNRKSGLLKLARDVVVTSADMQANLAEALVDTTTNNVTSEQPVTVKFLQGTLNSQRLEIASGGEVIRFIGDVKMVLDNLGDLPAPQPQPQSARGAPRR